MCVCVCVCACVCVCGGKLECVCVCVCVCVCADLAVCPPTFTCLPQAARSCFSFVLSLSLSLYTCLSRYFSSLFISTNLLFHSLVPSWFSFPSFFLVPFVFKMIIFDSFSSARWLPTPDCFLPSFLLVPESIASAGLPLGVPRSTGASPSSSSFFRFPSLSSQFFRHDRCRPVKGCYYFVLSLSRSFVGSFVRSFFLSLSLTESCCCVCVCVCVCVSMIISVFLSRGLHQPFSLPQSSAFSHTAPAPVYWNYRSEMCELLLAITRHVTSWWMKLPNDLLPRRLHFWLAFFFAWTGPRYFGYQLSFQSTATYLFLLSIGDILRLFGLGFLLVLLLLGLVTPPPVLHLRATATTLSPSHSLLLQSTTHSLSEPELPPLQRTVAQPSQRYRGNAVSASRSHSTPPAAD